MDAELSRLFTAGAAYDSGQSAVSLDQLSDEDFWRHVQKLALQESSSTVTREYLECELARHRCLLPLDALSEVCLPPSLYAFLPALPSWIRGLAAWHGEVIGVVDLDAFLTAQSPGDDGLQQAGRDERDERDQSAPTGMLLVAVHHTIPIGLHVRSIGRTWAVDSGAVVRAEPDAAAWIDQSRAAFVTGTLDDAVILELPALLDVVIDAINLASQDRLEGHG
jgi:chemotaxis signal transduction protein